MTSPAERAAASTLLGALATDPGRALICLDYDGTLAPIVLDPAQAHPHPGARALLVDLSRTFGTVAVLTGRPAADTVALLGLDGCEVLVLGLYGRERWSRTGGLTREPPPPTMPVARGEVEALIAGTGLRLEDKGAALAVHARGLADPDAALRGVAAALAGIAERHGLQVRDGRLVRELLAPGPDKGEALRDVLHEIGPAACLYAGDDAADVLAFRALRNAGLPGLAIAVANPENPAVAAEADLVAADPNELIEILMRLLQDSAVR